MLPFAIPPSHGQIKVVASFDELISTPLDNGINALCWQREPVTAEGFREIVENLGVIEEITPLDEDDLNALSLSDAGKAARRLLIQDQRLLRNAGLDPMLDCIPAYPRDANEGPVPIDVYDFHADSATVIADTFLCSYNVAASEGIRNEDAVRYVDIPEIRAKLLTRHGGSDDEAFLGFLKDNFYDLHYTYAPQVEPYSFGLGNLWRIATKCPASPVPPCIHRAPTTQPGQHPRLLLIS